MHIFKSPRPDFVPAALSVTELVFRNLETRPDEVVLIDGPTGRSLTARAFMDQVRRLAGGLTAAGFGAGHCVAIMTPNIPEFCVVFHAVALAGGTVTTINPTYTAPEVMHQLTDAGAELLVTVGPFLEVARAAVAGTKVREIAVIGPGEGTLPLTALMGEPLAAQVPVDLERHVLVLPYSSGTTGLPKGVMLSHRNLTVNVEQMIEHVDFRAGETTAGFLPFFHIYGMTVLMNLHLAGGGTVVTMPRFDLEMFLRLSQDHKARRMWVVPPVALALAKHPMVGGFDLSSVEQVFSGAAPLGAELSDAVGARLGCVCLQGYGMTEMSPVSHATPISAARAGASGLLLPNTLARIVDPVSGEDQGPGGEGELWVKGPQVMLGYLNNARATAETLDAGGWLHTGDIARIDADGYMFIVDRLKELIKYKGFQVAPAEVEATLVALPGIIDAAVVGQADPEAGEIPVAFVVRAEGGPDEAAIRAHLEANLAHYKQVHRIIVTDAIPKSASGKILRRLLRDRLTAGQG